MNERLWSPAMRKWARDADRHGIAIGLVRTRPSRGDWMGGANPNVDRITDDLRLRILDGPNLSVIINAPRTVDRIF